MTNSLVIDTKTVVTVYKYNKLYQRIVDYVAGANIGHAVRFSDRDKPWDGIYFELNGEQSARFLRHFRDELP